MMLPPVRCRGCGFIAKGAIDVLAHAERVTRSRLHPEEVVWEEYRPK